MEDEGAADVVDEAGRTRAASSRCRVGRAARFFGEMTRRGAARGPLAASRLDREAEVARDDAGEVQDAVRKPYESLERAVSL